MLPEPATRESYRGATVGDFPVPALSRSLRAAPPARVAYSYPAPPPNCSAQLKKMKPGPAKTSVQKRAMAILKQKKMYEKQKESTMNQQFNVDQIMFAQETLTETVGTVSAMKDANKALKKQFKAININQVTLSPNPNL